MTGGTLKPQRNALYAVKTSKKVIKSLETIVILQVSIGVVPTMTAIYSFQCYKITVFLHNLKNYDSHLIIERANELSERGKIDVIAQNSEKFISFAFKSLCFKDSFSFLSSSLDKLVKLSKYEDGEKKQNWQNNFKFSKRNPYVSNDEDLDLLTDKGVYPYDYLLHFI